MFPAVAAGESSGREYRTFFRGGPNNCSGFTVRTLDDDFVVEIVNGFFGVCEFLSHQFFANARLEGLLRSGSVAKVPLKTEVIRLFYNQHHGFVRA